MPRGAFPCYIRCQKAVVDILACYVELSSVVTVTYTGPGVNHAAMWLHRVPPRPSQKHGNPTAARCQSTGWEFPWILHTLQIVCVCLV